MIGMLGRLGVGGAYDPVSQITNIRKLSGEYTRHGNLNLQMFAVEVKAHPLQGPQTIEFAYAAPEMERALQEWTDAGAVLDRGRTKKLLDARVAAALLLDVLNLGLSIKAAAEAKDGAKRVRAMLDSGVAGVSVMVNLAEHGMKNGWLTLHAHHRAQGMKTVFRLRILVSLYYGVANLSDALSAFRSGDNDRGYALSIAAAAEFATIGGYFWAALAPGSLVAPWLRLGRSLIFQGDDVPAHKVDEIADRLNAMLLEYHEREEVRAWLRSRERAMKAGTSTGRRDTTADARHAAEEVRGS